MFCGRHDLSELHVSCVRFVWRALLPAVFLLALGIIYVTPAPPSNSKIIRRIKRSWTPFLTLAGARILLGGTRPVQDDALASVTKQNATSKRRSVLRLTVPIVTLSLVETIAWLAVFSYHLSLGHETPILISAVMAVAWGYTFARLLIKPTMTPPYDLLLLLTMHFTTSILGILGHAYDKYAYGKGWPSVWIIIAEFADLSVISALLVVILRTPVEDTGDPDEIPGSPEDYATIWSWMTFGFVNPLIKNGQEKTLEEDDVFELSPHHQAKPLLRRFSTVKGKTLMRRIWVMNSLDLLMDGILTLVSVIFNYSGPFFLKRILDAIADPTPKSIARAYVYALLTFLCSIIKNQADMQHLWYGRQAVTRTRSILMTAVFDKAMKRKDYRGVTSVNDKKGGAKGKISIRKAALESMGKLKSGKNGDGKKGFGAGADIGKIVNLMSGDASKASQILGQIYNIYGAPFEIIVGTVFLYQLLGISAFAGFLALLSVAPLNHYLSKKRIFISRGIAAARDRRMAVLNELFVSVKFIKLCAWDQQWIDRSEKARAKEIKWILRERWNTILFSFLWACAPILVSVFSFMAFVAQGNELTVSIAFTSIVLFNLLRQPLNVLPNLLAQFLQARVSIDRIAAFFAEDEVDDQVSSLKMKSHVMTTVPDATLGIVGNASFAWNSVPSSDGKKPSGGNGVVPTTATQDGASQAQGRVSPVDSDSNSEEPKFELQDIDITFPEGRLTLVTGPTASGKTALLLAQLGEMTMINAPGSSSNAKESRIILPKYPYAPPDQYGYRACVSYAAQAPWLEHLTIRDNILFGEPFESERYWTVIESCALKADLEMLEDGDLTEIGERGISLSGGQKARVALARAVYARSKIVLLDDPLSAVDSHTARFLYERLLRGPLLRNRTVVLVTHHVELVLPAAHYFVQMQDGRIDFQGNVRELQEQGVLEDITVELVSEDSNAPSFDDDDMTESVESEPRNTKQPEAIPGPDLKWIAEQQEKEKNRKKPKHLIEAESRETGSVKWHIYDTYLKASGYVTWVIILALIAVAQLFGFFEKYWIKVWGEAYNDVDTAVKASRIWQYPRYSSIHSQASDVFAQHDHIQLAFVDSPSLNAAFALPPANRHPLFYVMVYAAIGFGGVIITSINTVVQYGGAVHASRALFRRLLNSLVYATMRWHDITPTGRILNRLSRDMEVLDSSLSNSLRAVIFRLATFIASIFTVAYVFPEFLIPAAIISYFYYRISQGYISAGRDMRRMQSTTRSPIFASFAETLEGIVTVRAFGAERRFLEVLMKRIDLATKMWYGWWMMNRWLLLRFDALGALSIFIITLFALSGYISAGWAGITITSAMQFTISVYWTCRLATQLELDLNSVERIVEYLDLPQEPPAVLEGKAVPAYWPSTTSHSDQGLNESGNRYGQPLAKTFINVENLVIRYSPELPPVLHGVSFGVQAGEKIGLLGRTGSGKSTLAMSLLRFVDPSSGRIMIDGIDITSIGLRDLRSRITIIPQDSILFSGTLRDNLDPFEEHTDSECLDALYRVHLLTPGARTRASTVVIGDRPPSRVSHSSTNILDRPLTPEPDTLGGDLSRHSNRLRPSDTMLAPRVIHTGGSISPIQPSDTLLFEFGIPRQATVEADVVGFRFGGDNFDSEVASPTGAQTPARQSHGLLRGLAQIHGGLSAGGETPVHASNGDTQQSDGTGNTSTTEGTIKAQGQRYPRAQTGTTSRSDNLETSLLTLDTRVASGGANFSSGQRQLISLARALLRHNTIVILDEATSSIDFETDAKIQATVREEFSSSCLITIAHRIRTVIDYDRLIILDKGRIAEIDTPWNLIQKEGGIFRDMCLKSGQMRELETMARAKNTTKSSR